MVYSVYRTVVHLSAAGDSNVGHFRGIRAYDRRKEIEERDVYSKSF